MTSTGNRWVHLQRFLPLGVGLVLAVVATKMWLQATHPFLEHDDWFYILPVDSPHDSVVYQRLIAEGRWLNYLWWLGPGHLFSPVGAAVLYEVAFLALVGRLAWRWTPGWWSVPTVVALAVSPMILELSFWPGTLALSTTIGAVAVWTLPWCTQTRTRLAIWIGAAVLLTFLSYPPMTLVLLVVLLVELIERDYRELFWTTVAFGVAYVVSTLVVFTLNKIAFGTFGIEVRPWRHPNALHGLDDLWENLGRVFDQAYDFAGTATIPVVLGLLALAACIALPQTRTRGTKLLLIGIAAWGLQSSGTVMTGAVTPFRSCAWVWVVLVLAIIWLLAAVELGTWVRLSAAAAVTVTALWGARAAWRGVDYNQDRLDTYNTVDRQLASWEKRVPYARVLVFGNDKDWGNDVFTQEAEWFKEVAAYRRGTDVFYCRPPLCNVGLRPSVLERVRAGAKVIRSGNFLVIVPPSHYKDLPAYTN